MSKPNYRVTMSFDADRKVFLARAPELEHCTAEGADRAEAISHLEEEIDAQLANMLSHGTTPPRSIDEEVFSGELQCKVSRLLHRDLAYQARAEGIEVNHLVGELLAASMEGRRQSHRTQRGGNRQPQENVPHDNIGNRHDGGGPPRRQGGFGPGRNNYHAVMDDRANFIEYVRGLEQGHGPGPGRGGPGGGGGGGGGDRGGDRGRRRRGRGGAGGGGGHGQHMRGPQGHGGGQGFNGNAGGQMRSAAPAGAPNGEGGNGGGGEGAPTGGGNPGNGSAT